MRYLLKLLREAWNRREYTISFNGNFVRFEDNPKYKQKEPNHVLD